MYLRQNTRLFFYSLTLALCLTVLLPAAPLHASTSATQQLFTAIKEKDWDRAFNAAERTDSQGLLDLAHWYYVQDADSGATFETIRSFMLTNPHWPEMADIQIRAEYAMRDAQLSEKELRDWFTRYPPITGIARLNYAELLIRQGHGITDNQVASLIREAWREGHFTPEEEEHITRSYARILTQSDHITRVDELLWNGRTSMAKRVLHTLPADIRQQAEVRIALLDDHKDAASMLDRLPSQLRNDPGVQYARLVWRDRAGLDSGVREMLYAAPENTPYAEKWWKYREREVRRLIDQREYKAARRLLDNHGLQEGSNFAEALWLAGWLSTEFLNDPQDGYLQFYRMYDAVDTPVSKARAAYWSARASANSGDKETAENWYQIAASHPTVFYGQLAMHKLNGNATNLRLVSDRPSYTTPPLPLDIADAIRASTLAGEYFTASKLLNHVIREASTPEQAVAIADYVRKYTQSRTLGVRAAKQALRRDKYMLDISYPNLGLRDDVVVEPALIHAVTRQESLFDEQAKSHAGARGLMQLLPSTAKEVARKAGHSYSLSSLYDSSYNIRLGSLYLERLINSYDGSYILAIASYNAGPGNVRKWIREMGYPAKDPDAAVNWIERIPFSETRNYVQRVMENLQVYRVLLAGRNDSKLALVQDLER